MCERIVRGPCLIESQILKSWWVWEILELDKHQALCILNLVDLNLVLHYSEGAADAAAAFLCHYYLLRT
jgi:hypothetical protein